MEVNRQRMSLILEENNNPNELLLEIIPLLQDIKIAEGKTEAEVYSESYDVFHKMYHHWEEKVKYMINSFTFKK